MKMCTYDLINNISFKSSIDENKKFKLKKQIVIASITLVFIASFLAFSLVLKLPYHMIQLACMLNLFLL